MLQHLARRTPDSRYVLALGKVLNKFKVSSYLDSSHRAADEVQEYLESIVREQCSSPSSGKYEIVYSLLHNDATCYCNNCDKRLQYLTNYLHYFYIIDVNSKSMATSAIKSLAPLSTSDLEQFTDCLSTDVPDEVKLAYSQSLQSQNSITSPEVFKNTP